MHSGHRQRMRERVKEGGLDKLSDHEFLELLLYYVQPRVNTNVSAHHLMDTFGSISSVFESSEEALLKVPGIGPISASFLTLIPEICRRYYAEKYHPSDTPSSYPQIIDYAQKMFVGYKKEVVGILMLDGANKLIAKKILDEGSYHNVRIDNQQLLAEILQSKADKVILVHNHPSNNPKPSAADFSMTAQIGSVLKFVGITFFDHLILCPNGKVYSFSAENYL